MTNPAQSTDSFNLGIFLYDDVEELDFCGPFEVLKSAASMRSDRQRKPDWQVFTVAEELRLLETSGGLLIKPHFDFSHHPPIDVLVIPGGAATHQLERPLVLEWLKSVTGHTQLNTSVCTGAFLLGALGLLDGHHVTTHWSALDELAARYPKTQVRRQVRWIDEGTLVTAAGISAGIDMSLHLVERLDGRELAEKVAHYMEYQWNQQSDRAF
ncbi:MAG: DJ-1/PfpI family protein [Ktedonobacterales bacterium]